MGYTHYWRSSRGIAPALARPFLAAVRAVLSHPSCPRVVYESDEPQTPPEITLDHVCFNGVGREGCETFWLSLDVPIKFFCTKTRQRPYDAAVVAVLTLAHHFDPDWLDISSDGDPQNWAEGVSLAKSVVADCVNPLLRSTPEVAS